jgi:signal transduction histidine kinase
LSERSLKQRLFGVSALWVAATVVIVGAVLFYLFTSNVERAARSDMLASLNRLIAVIDPEMPAPAITEPLPDPRYSVPMSGQYWQIELEGGATTRSRSLWDTTLTTPNLSTPGQEVLSTVRGPQQRPTAALTKLVQFQTAQKRKTYRVTVAQDRQVLDDSIHKFGGDLALTLVVLAASLVGAASVQVGYGLRPLFALRDDVEAIRRGTKARLDGPYPSEVNPLVAEINELLSAREKSEAFAKARASDLAHGLKTPLSVLRTTAERIEVNGDAETAKTLAGLVDEMSDRINYQLRLARLKVRTQSRSGGSSLHAALDSTLAVLKKTHRGEALEWVVESAGELMLDIDRNDLLELLGIVLENASEWATSRVLVRTFEEDWFASICIDDDGQGLTDEQMQSLGIRGKRYDESRPGNGLGLAIAFEIASLNRGALEFKRSDLGGLTVLLRLPRHSS